MLSITRSSPSIWQRVTTRQFRSVAVVQPKASERERRCTLVIVAVNHQISPNSARTVVRTMAGHNKGRKIRHKKGTNDVKKSLALGKASKSLAVVSKECKGDLSDPRLQAAIQHANSSKLPKDRIEDAIEKGRINATSKGSEFFRLRFDGMMRLENNTTSIGADASSFQVACIITTLSDNRNRTTQNIRSLVNKHGENFFRPTT